MTTNTYAAAFSGILDALPTAARQVYGERLLSLVLFGSVARGTMRPDSDIDLLVVAEPLPEDRFGRVREFEAVEARLAPQFAAARTADVNTFLSPIFKTRAELAEGSFVFLDLPDEGRILHDPQAVAATYLASLKARLAAQGARRIDFGGGHYWLLQPDAPPGTPIPL